MSVSEERRLQALILAPIRRIQRRLNSLAWAEAGVFPLWAAGTTCLLLRLLLRDSALWLLPLPFAAALAWWFHRARPRLISFTHAAVLADRAANAGGLLLTRLERPVGAWELAANQYARAIQPPKVNWQRAASNLLTALAFCAFCLTLPLPEPSPSPPSAAAAAKVAAVQAKAESLAQEEPLGAPVEEELRRLAEEAAENRFDEADWEAADSLEAALSERAAQAASELAAAAEAARELEGALDSSASAEAAAREMENLERALQELGPDSATPQQGSSSNRSRDDVASLRRSLEQRRQSLEQRFGQGNENGTGNSRPGMARRPGNRQGQGEGQGQGQGQQGQGQGQGQGHLSQQVPRGNGAGRGGESQPLQFGEQAQMDPERLAYQPLPKGQGGEAEQLWGLRAADPPRPGAPGLPAATPQGSPPQGDASPGHGSAPLLPRNRDLIQRYFGGQP
jgi:hypothetical protein